MLRAIHNRNFWLVPALATILFTVTCTLDITEPVESPPETWDPVLNTHPDAPVFQELLNQYVREGLPGVVLYVRTPQGQWNGAAGYMKIETATKMQPTNLFFAASITKLYIATATMLLVENNQINLDAMINQYLPETIYGDIPNGNKANVRQLLGHTSGIPNFTEKFKFDLDWFNNPVSSLSYEQMLSYLHGQAPWSLPGARLFYSNTNYLLLALIIDHVTGSSHAKFITEQIFQPLGLNSTYYRNEPEYPNPPGLVNSYEDLAGDGRLMNVSDLSSTSSAESIGYSGLIASSADFAAFVEALLKGSIINQETLAEMQKRTVSFKWGLGLHFSSTSFGIGIGHDGSNIGTKSHVEYFPDMDATLVLLVNSGNNGVIAGLFKRLWEEAMQTALGGL